MAREKGTITGTGTTKEVRIQGPFDLDLSGFGVATVQLQRKFADDDAFTDVDAAFTADAQKVGKQNLTGAKYRFNCTAYTSGTIAWVLGSIGS